MKLVYAMKDAAKVSTDQLAEHPGRYLMSTRSGFGLTKVFDKVGAEHVELVWSLWPGYLTRDGCSMREWAEKKAVHVHFIHSGGHAWPEDLARLTEALAAEETSVVHCEVGPAKATGGSSGLVMSQWSSRLLAMSLYLTAPERATTVPRTSSSR